MNKTKILAIISTALMVFSGVLFITFFVIKILWAWTIPDLFPGAVEQGLIASEISWFTSFKLALFLSVLLGATKVKTKINKT